MDINRTVKENDAVMFDIDDTLISSRDKKVIEPVYNIYKSLKERGYKIVIITARPGFQENIEWTERQLREINVQYDVLVFTPPENKGNGRRQTSYAKPWMKLGFKRKTMLMEVIPLFVSVPNCKPN